MLQAHLPCVYITVCKVAMNVDHELYLMTLNIYIRMLSIAMDLSYILV